MLPSSHPTFAAALWPAPASPSAVPSAVRAGALALLGALVLTVSARAQVPFFPVPMTLQDLAVMVIAVALGGRLGAFAVAVYLVEGALGLPVFANTPERGLGLFYMAGPTGGFLAGFLVAAGFVGFCAGRGLDRGFARLAGVMLVGYVIVFAMGYAWLAHLFGGRIAWSAGVEPFLLPTLVKILLAAAAVPALWRVLGRVR